MSADAKHLHPVEDAEPSDDDATEPPGRSWPEIGSNLAEIGGIAAIAAGFGWFSPGLGLIFGGFGLVVVGFLTGLPKS